MTKTVPKTGMKTAGIGTIPTNVMKIDPETAEWTIETTETTFSVIGIGAMMIGEMIETRVIAGITIGIIAIVTTGIISGVGEAVVAPSTMVMPNGEEKVTTIKTTKKNQTRNKSRISASPGN